MNVKFDKIFNKKKYLKTITFIYLSFNESYKAAHGSITIIEILTCEIDT